MPGGPQRVWLAFTRDWYEPGERQPRTAWVAEWVDDSGDRPTYRRELVELDASADVDDAGRQALLGRAARVIERSAPSEPVAFGFAGTGSQTRAALFERVKLTTFAVDEASGRVDDAARRQDEYAATSLSVALTEMLAWLRGFDELMTYVWGSAIASDVRARTSQETDESLARLSEVPPKLRGTVARRSMDGAPYDDWTFALLSKGLLLDRDELQGLRWLAGKMLHYGPLPVAELRQPSPGAEPRWKWRPSDTIHPSSEPERQPRQRDAYDRFLTGRDVLGTCRLTVVLIESEYLFYRLLRDSDELEGTSWAGS